MAYRVFKAGAKRAVYTVSQYGVYRKALMAQHLTHAVYTGCFHFKVSYTKVLMPEGINYLYKIG